jgi:hypothetical protein
MDCGKDCVFGNEEGGDDAHFVVIPAQTRSLARDREEVVLLRNNYSSKCISFDE